MSDNFVRGEPLLFRTRLQSVNSYAVQKNPTIMAGDFLVARDEGPLVPPINPPYVNPNNHKEVLLQLTAEETDARCIVIEWEQQGGDQQWLPDSACIYAVQNVVARQITLLETKARTDLLPDQPAAAGDEMQLIDGGITSAKIAPSALSASKFATGAITLRVVAEEVIDAIAESVDAELEAELSAIYELVGTRLATAAYVAPDNASLGTLVQFAMADKRIDDSDPTSWQHVISFAGEELLRQGMYDILGSPVRSINTPVAQVKI